MVWSTIAGIIYCIGPLRENASGGGRRRRMWTSILGNHVAWVERKGEVGEVDYTNLKGIVRVPRRLRRILLLTDQSRDHRLR